MRFLISASPWMEVHKKKDAHRVQTITRSEATQSWFRRKCDPHSRHDLLFPGPPTSPPSTHSTKSRWLKSQHDASDAVLTRKTLPFILVLIREEENRPVYPASNLPNTPVASPFSLLPNPSPSPACFRFFPLRFSSDV